MVHFYRLAIALISLLFAVNAVAETCDVVSAAATSLGQSWVSSQNAAHNNCLATAGGGDYNCGARDPGFIVEAGSVGVQQQYRVKMWSTGDGYSGSIYSSHYSPWVNCTTDLTTPAPSPSKVVVDALNLLGQPLCFLGSPALSTCYAGFVITSGFGGSGSAGQSCIYPNFASTGATCTGTTLPTAAPVPCKTGEVPGQVNGVDVCVKAGSTTSTDTTSTDTKPGTDSSGNPTTTDSTTSSSTKCDGTNCTTTTTTTTTGGSSGTPDTTTTTSTKPQATFCAENPASPQCTTGTFSGACGAAPACTGDAVQCAQATFAFQAACSLAKPSDSAESAAYATAVANADGDKTANLEGNSTVNFSPSSFDQTEFLGAASGVSDLTIEVMGHTAVLKFSMLNVWLARLGNVLLAVTFLLCIRIVTRG